MNSGYPKINRQATPSSGGEKFRRSEQPPLEIAWASLDRIHVSGPSTRSMSPDSWRHVCLSVLICGSYMPEAGLCIYVSVSTSLNPLQDPCLRTHVSMSIAAGPLPDEAKSTPRYSESEIGAAPQRHAKKQSSNMFQPHLDVSLPIRNTKPTSPSNLSRRRNANFDLRRHVFCGPAQRNQRKNSARIPPTLRPRPRTALYYDRKNPSVWPHCLGKNEKKQKNILKFQKLFFL